MFGIEAFSAARVRWAGAHGVRRLAFYLLATCLLVALGASASAASASEPEDFSGSAYQILAPGEGGFPPPERAPSSTFDQGLLYDALTPLQGNVTAADLEKYYLSEKFGVTGPVIEEEPGAGPGHQARQKRHSPRLRSNARTGDVRLGLGRREGPGSAPEDGRGAVIRSDA